uniref:Urease accessory protein n=1 Tax=Candidatus Kentrum sp. LFY TaxID=2126342 RepID=A0A450X536_9GAMM|nr:MAG: urease accessory protein [Candidatus Kentron sp. LFY]
MVLTLIHGRFPIAVLGLLFPAIALAHQATGSGFLAGITHPVLGLDHLLAMLCVGIISAQLGGRVIWLVPTTFVSVMVIGGILGMFDVTFPAVEIGIAFSVVVLGATIAFARKMPISIPMVMVSIFALFHGYAHGMEMPTIADPFLYALGFVVGTALIHLTGVLIGYLAMRRTRTAEGLRFVGAVIAGIGLQLLIG